MGNGIKPTNLNVIYICLCFFFLFLASLAISVAATYIRKYFNKESKNAVNTMVNSIHKEFIAMLKTVPWMDETTRKSALEKATAMEFHIGYPNELTDDAILSEYYRDLELQYDSQLQNMLRIQKFHRKKSAFREPIDKSDWRILGATATEVNAFYAAQYNSIGRFKKH